MTALIVVPNYFTSRPMANLLQSLTVQSDPDWVALIVDNSGDEQEFAAVENLARSDTRIRAIASPTNIGYFNSLRVAESHFGDLSRFEQVWLCNPDLILDYTALRSSSRAASDAFSTGVLAPLLFSELEKTDTNPFLRRRPGRFWWWRLRVVFGVPLISRLYVYAASLRRRNTRAGGPLRRNEVIYAPHGACVIFLREYFARRGATARPEWLFLEELTIAEECRRIGLLVRRERSIFVRHIEHASTGTWRSHKLLSAQRESIHSVYSRYMPW